MHKHAHYMDKFIMPALRLVGVTGDDIRTKDDELPDAQFWH